MGRLCVFTIHLFAIKLVSAKEVNHSGRQADKTSLLSPLPQ